MRPIVIGPKTRLAGELLRQLKVAAAFWSRPLLLARSVAELAELQVTYPNATVSELEQIHSAVSTGVEEPVMIFCCALGPLHPRAAPRLSQDLLAVGREIESISALLDALPKVPVHMVYVSTVLAVSCGPGRNYYSGWKRLLDAAISMTVGCHPLARCSVVFPGRLVAERSLRHPGSWLSTSYRQVAARMMQMSAEPATRCVIGLDARLYLLQRSMATCWSALSGTTV